MQCLTTMLFIPVIERCSLLSLLSASFVLPCHSAAAATRPSSVLKSDDRLLTATASSLKDQKSEVIRAV